MKKAAIILLVAAILAGGYFYIREAALSRVVAVTLEKDAQGSRLLVDKKPFLVRGVCYSPIPIGKDYEYNYWGDASKPWITDGKWMQKMGVNTVRFYRVGKNPKEVRRVVDDLYRQFGIHSLLGTYLGFWNWPPPNYTDEEFKEKVRAEALEMVKLYKNSPGVLAWVLGNENNYSFDRDIQRWSSDAIDALPTPEEQRKEKARIYYSFVNGLAKEIKKIDPNHLVIMGVGETASLEVAKEVCPDVDALGMIAYRGPGFGNLFRQVKEKFDIPIVMTEWGADSYNAATREEDETNQADFLKLQWQDIERNTYGKKGAGNVLGVTLFEWTDEWWKGNENIPTTWSVQDTAGHWQNTSYHFDAYGADKLNMNEEWWGVVKLNPKRRAGGVNERIPKESYSVLKELWTK